AVVAARDPSRAAAHAAGEPAVARVGERAVLCRTVREGGLSNRPRAAGRGVVGVPAARPRHGAGGRYGPQCQPRAADPWLGRYLEDIGLDRAAGDGAADGPG